jgi:two-component system, LytTR family, response regulator
MRVLIVDDEAPARARLRRLLTAVSGVEIVGEAADGEHALAQVQALAPDAVLLDIQMPGISGLDVAASLPEPRPAVIFVTAFDDYAVAAFAAAAVDYLLKPVESSRLVLALTRVHERRPPRAAMAPEHLLIPDRGRTHVIACRDIEWLEAADNYVIVHAGDRAPLMRRPLAALLADLGPGFLRVHRSRAVAAAHVREVQTLDKGDALLVLHGGAALRCSRQHRAALLASLAALTGLANTSRP